MPDEFELTPLWQKAFAPLADDQHADHRSRLRLSYFSLRKTVQHLADSIASDLPMFTDHGLAHADALWGMASTIGGDISLNPAEAFVLGGAFLLHDLGMALAAYPGGEADLERDPKFADLVAIEEQRLSSTDRSASSERVRTGARQHAIAELLRRRHASKAEELITQAFSLSNGDSVYLIEDHQLRLFFGRQIGQIAHSHWWPVADLKDKFAPPQGSCPAFPSDWVVDRLKLACLLRTADAAHIDHRRAPSLLHAFRKPSGLSRSHWYFQERLLRPVVQGDRLLYTSTGPFVADEAEAWWLAFETIQLINDELRQVDALLADMGRERLALRSVVGAGSPDRLSEVIPVDGWNPLDARLKVGDTVQVIANIGGRDLYGNRPDIALRELIANASDAVKARAAFEGTSPRPVSITLEEEDGSWWLEVADQGVGMTPEVMIDALTDFGHSHWRSDAMVEDFPGLAATGFEPAGKFGIGFFAVFLAADEIYVHSRGYNDAPRDTHVLVFRNGLAGRPLLRRANDLNEQLRDSGTKVRIRLREDPRSVKGIFRRVSKRLSYTQLLHSIVSRMCALSEVDILVQGPDDPRPRLVIEADDWIDLPTGQLFRRLYQQGGENLVEREALERCEKLFIDRETRIYGADGRVNGRAAIVTPMEMWTAGAFDSDKMGQLYVGGLQSSIFQNTLGAFRAQPLKADRLSAFPLGPVAAIADWANSQATRIKDLEGFSAARLWTLADYICGLGGKADELPCVRTIEGGLNQTQLASWLKDRPLVHLISRSEFIDYPDGTPWGFYTRDGKSVALPDHGLLVDFFPLWLIPEDICPRPKDYRFEDIVADLDDDDPQAWWHQWGNFGPVSLAVMTVADVWGVDVVDLVKGMQGNYATDKEDGRLEIPTVGGGTTKATAYTLMRDDYGRSE